MADVMEMPWNVYKAYLNAETKAQKASSAAQFRVTSVAMRGGKEQFKRLSKDLSE